MSFSEANKNFKIIGLNNVTRRACSFKYAADTLIRQIAFNGAVMSGLVSAGWSEANMSPDIATTLKWEVRASTNATAPAHSPETGEIVDGIPDNSILFDTGSFSISPDSAFKIDKMVHYTVNLNSNLVCAANVEYFFVLRLADSEVNLLYPFVWYTTLETSVYTPDAAIYDSAYTQGAPDAWGVGDNALNLSLDIETAQAGVNWDLVINGHGYMSPDGMKSATKETISSGIASTRGGQSEYSQLRYPYSSMSQSNWTSGTGQLNMDDQAAYLYGLSLDTRNPKQMMLGPLAHQTGINLHLGTIDTGSRYGVHLPDESSPTYLWYAQPFTVGDSNVSCAAIGIFTAKLAATVGRTLTLGIYSDNAGSPGSIPDGFPALATVTTPAPYYWIKWVDTPYACTLVANTSYWLVIYSANSAIDLYGYSIGFNTPAYAGGLPKKSVDGASWSTFGQLNATNVYMEFRINCGINTALNGNVYNLKYGEVATTYTGSGSGTAYLIATAGEKAYKWDTSTNYWVDISTGIGGCNADGTSANVSQANIVDAIFFDGKLICTQSGTTIGYDYPMRVWNGTYWGPASNTNLVNNGSFTSNTSGWTAVNATLASEAGGQSGNRLRVTNSGAAAGYCYQSVTTIPGVWYELVFWQWNGNTDARVKIGTSAAGGEYWNPNDISSVSGWIRYSFIFKATGATTYIYLGVGDEISGDYTLFDTVGLYEAPVGKILHIGKGFVWASNSVNTVKRSNNGTTWSAAITIGESIYNITAFANFQGNLLVGKEDGIWSIDNNDLAEEYLIFREHAAPTNCVDMCVWSGMLFIPVQNSLWRWQGSQYKEVGPTDKRNGPAKYWPNKISKLASTAPYLYATTIPVVTGGMGGLMAYDGMGWHHLTASAKSSRASWAICTTSEIGVDQNRVWWSEGDVIYYITQPTFTNNRYDWTSADFASNGVFVSSWFDGGVKDALKYWNRLVIIADVPENTYIEVYYAKDGEEWETVTSNIQLGTITSKTLADSKECVLMFPDGMTAKSGQLIFKLCTSTSAKTPRIKAFNLEAAVRQPPVYSYSARVLLADRIMKMNGSVETARTGRQMELELEALEASESPITFSWPDMSIRGFISFQRVNTEQYAPNGTQSNRWDKVDSLSIIETK